MSDTKSPIMSGWRGHINGTIEKTVDSSIKISNIDINLDFDTAWALCNLLTDDAIERAKAVEGKQIDQMSNLGAALGRMIDHDSANNGDRRIIS